MRHQRAIAGRADHEVHVGRSKRVTSELFQQLTRGTVARNRIAHGHDRLELVLAMGVGAERRSQMAARLLGVLHVIELVGCRLPNLDFRAHYWRCVIVRDTATHDEGLAIFLAQQDRFTVG